MVHDDVIKWKHFPRNWPFVRGNHRSQVNSPRKGQWRGALMFSLICVWINDWVNNREAGDLRRYRAHYDVIVMENKRFALRDNCRHTMLHDCKWGLSIRTYVYVEFIIFITMASHDRNVASNHQSLRCLFNSLCGPVIVEPPKSEALALCEGNSPVTGEFPAQRASNA